MASQFKVGVREFQKILKEDLSEECANKGWDYNNESRRGLAFQYWLAKLIRNYEQGYEPEPEDAVLRSRDLKADVVMEDPERQHLLICQCKHTRRDKNALEEEVSDFFAKHQHYSNRDWVESHGSKHAADLLAEYGEKLNAGYAATYRFYTTGRVSARIRELAGKQNDVYAESGEPINCELYDFSDLKDYYSRARASAVPTPEEVAIDLPQGRYIMKDKPYPTVVAVIKGNAVRNLYRQWKDSLFAWNIRGYLGNKGINSDISRTAKQRPSDFFYFNNGISAICTKFKIAKEGKSTRLVINNFQIINGAQTTSSIAKAAPDEELEILFRLTRTSSVKTDKGMNTQIIRYNNSQNSVRVSDFRSNDPIQRWLENRFKRQKPKGSIPNLHYRRRREVGGGRGLGKGIDLALFGKIRYAFLRDPIRLHSVPRSLYVRRDDDSAGLYDEAFGVDGVLLDHWADETFREALLAIVFYLHIEARLKELARADAEFKSYNRMRFHLLALAGDFFRLRKEAKTESSRDYLRSEASFKERFEIFKEPAEDIVTDQWENASREGSTIFAFLRNVDRWHDMKGHFVRKIKRKMI